MIQLSQQALFQCDAVKITFEVRCTTRDLQCRSKHLELQGNSPRLQSPTPSPTFHGAKLGLLIPTVHATEFVPQDAGGNPMLGKGTVLGVRKASVGKSHPLTKIIGMPKAPGSPALEALQWPRPLSSSRRELLRLAHGGRGRRLRRSDHGSSDSFHGMQAGKSSLVQSIRVGPSISKPGSHGIWSFDLACWPLEFTLGTRAREDRGAEEGAHLEFDEVVGMLKCGASSHPSLPFLNRTNRTVFLCFP